jgi:hypothetical protein
MDQAAGFSSDMSVAQSTSSNCVGWSKGAPLA